jgi:hypothetical protein
LAGTAHDVKARQSAALLRFQEVRERRQRVETTRAEHTLAAAAGRERTAREDLDAGRAAAAAALAAAHTGLQGLVVAIGEIEALGMLERDWGREVASRTDRLAAAEAERREAEAIADAALAALRGQARMTAKRARIAAATESRWRRMLDAAQEIERDDQTAALWRPA